MLNQPTIDLMRQLGLTAMLEAYLELRGNAAAADLSHDEWLGLLLDREATGRANKRMQARLRTARLRLAAAFEDIDFRAPRGLDRGLILRLGSNQWIRDNNVVLITGACGVGKTFLACALGHKACRDGLSVIYRRCHRLFAALALARHDGSYPRLFRSLTRADLLILDDFGPEPLTADQRRDLLEIVEDRHGTGATLLASQLPLDRLHDVIADPTLADAILDRLVHAAHRIHLTGDSMRRRPAAAEPTAAPA